ncbi:unnamed protein product, partial [marine sediment metagenome]
SQGLQKAARKFFKNLEKIRSEGNATGNETV